MVTRSLAINAEELRVFPGSPEVAETIVFRFQNCTARKYELYIDGVRVDRGQLGESPLIISAVGHEVALANFGSQGQIQGKPFVAGDTFKLIEPLHTVELRLV